MEEKDELGWLTPYFNRLSTEPEQEQVDELFEVFKNDFIDNPFDVDGIPVKIRVNLYHNKDRLDEYYENYYETFVHIITRKSKTNKRYFVPQRANRIHWIKPVLVNKDDERITDFRYLEGNGAIRNYYWYEDENYMVITQLLNNNYLLITGFCVDEEGYNVEYYRKKYRNRIK
jgi:hypothetical protein